MGPLSNLARKVRSDFSSSDPAVATLVGWGRTPGAGVRVSERTALRLIDVYSCVRVIAETVGCLPFFVYRRRQGTSGSDKAYDHPVMQLLHDLPNDEMTSQTWRETMTGHLALSGNCYSVITRNGRGQALDVYPVEWPLAHPRRDPGTQKIVYDISDRGKTEPLPASEVLHIPGLGYDGIMGYSPIRMAAETIGLGMAGTEFLSRFYGQGMNVGAVLETAQGQEMDRDSRQALKEDLMEKGAGLANSWLPLVLPSGVKLNRIPIPMRDAQTVEILKLNRDQICGLFRVPPHLIANMDKATFSNIEEQSLNFVKYTMLPWLTRWEQACNWKLFTAREREQGYYVKFNVEGLLRGDYKSRQEGLAMQRQNGVISADEWRELEERNPIEDGSGQKYLVNGNMVPISAAGSPFRARLRRAVDGQRGVKAV